MTISNQRLSWIAPLAIFVLLAPFTPWIDQADVALSPTDSHSKKKDPTPVCSQ